MSDTKQGDPWYRPRNVSLAFLVAVLLFLGWAFLEVWQVYTAEPNPVVDYRAKLRELAEYHAGISSYDADNAWDLLVDAMNLADEIDAELVLQLASTDFEPRDEYDQGSIEYDRVYYGRTLPTNIQREARAIELMRKEGVFDLLQQFVESGPGIAPSGPEMPLIIGITDPYRSEARMLAQVLVASMRLSLADGDYNQVAAACNASLALGSTISYQGRGIDYLTAMAIEQLTLRELRYELIEAALDEVTCQRILTALRQHDLAPIELPIKGERICLYDKLQWSFSDDGNGDGYLVSALTEFDMPGLAVPKQSFVDATTSRFFYPSRAELLSLADPTIDACLARSLLLPSSRISATPTLGSFSTGFSDRYVMVTLILDSLQQFVDRQPARRISREGTRIMLALEAFYARHSRWPDSLGELVPEILPQPPVDPLHGGPFGYRLVDSDRFGRPYILYSFGLDATDDGGIEFNSGTNDVYRGVEPLTDYNLTDVDYVINKPRPEEW